jgi:DNA-binding transcriptional MerR regulator/methylmalonyl-CoA mutase cobalamin-binding subunit
MNDISMTYEEFCHPIKVVSLRTGLSKDVIRVWERRYEAISPGRSDSGRRLYSDADIDRLIKLKRVTSAGWRISDAASLTEDELDRLISEMTQQEQKDTDITGSVGQDDSCRDYLQECIKAVENLDAGKLASLLASASVALSIPKLLDGLVAPLLGEIGDRWHQGDLRIGNEHLASSVIRRFLDNLRESTGVYADGPVIIVTTPTGHSHEMGALMAAVAASTAGWKTVYLSPNLPSREIVASAIQLKARAVALSMIYPADNPVIVEELRFLREHLPEGVAIFLGGQAALSYMPVLNEIGAVYLTSFNDIFEPLARLRET